MSVMIICASNGKNLELSNRFKAALSELSTEAEVIDLTEMSLPLYSNLNDSEIPELINTLAPKVVATDKFIFVAPEYNGGLPPTFTNFMAWMSKTGEDWRESFNGKKAAIASFSGGGGHHCLTALRIQLSYIGMNVMGRQIVANYKAAVKDESIDAISKQLIG